jgi:hypothetical protein
MTRLTPWALICLLFFHAYGLAQAQKPVRTTEFHTDGGAVPPDTLEELWALADVVIEGVIAGTRSADLTHPTDSSISLTFTVYEVSPIQVFKRDSHLAATPTKIDVQRPGGIRDRGAYVEDLVDTRLPHFRRDERYVLFLKYLTDGKYTLAPVGASAVFWLNAAKPVPRGNSTLDRAIGTLNNGQLFDRLRRLGGGL